LSKRHQLNAEWVCVATIYLLRCRPFYVKMTLVPASGSVWRILAYTIGGAVIDVATSGRDGPRPSGSASSDAQGDHDDGQASISKSRELASRGLELGERQGHVADLCGGFAARLNVGAKPKRRARWQLRSWKR
jgi:hypothetical protein